LWFIYKYATIDLYIIFKIYFMKRLFNLFLCSVLGLASFSLLAVPSYAQTDWDWDDDYTYDSSYYDDWDYSYSYDGSEELAGLLGGASLVFGGVMMIVSVVLSLGMYIYSALTLMTIAKKLGYENGWFAWVPLLNIALLFQMGDKNPWLVLLVLIPGLGGLIIAILAIISLMTICEKRGYDKLLGLLSLIPVANLILLGVLAWGKKE
jgi:hypothetical protein